MCPDRSPSPADQYDGYGNNSSSVNYNDLFVCQEEDCSEEISWRTFDGGSSYCEDHEDICSAWRCDVRVGRRDEYCWEHNNYCVAKDCRQRIERPQTSCPKHTINSLTPSQCKGDGEKDSRWPYANRACPFTEHKVITADGYCQYHANQCAECPRRLASWDKYCFEHWNGSCKVIDCHQQTPNSRDSNHYIYCEQHAKLYGNSLSNYQNIQQEKTQRKQQKETEQTKLKSLVKANTNISGEIKEVERFSPWFNPNCATVIAENNNYLVYLVVYEPAKEKMEKIIAPIKIEGNYTSFSSAQGKATNLRANLQNSANPILEVFPNPNSSTSFNSLVSEPYVKIDYSASTSDFKPLDIVWVEKSNCGKSYHHVGVYIGNGELIEFTNDYKSGLIPSGEDIIKSLPNFMRGGITRKASWSKFLDGQKGSIRRYHPIIPFKDYKDIIANLVWAKDNGFWRENYNLANRNCEHFSNMAALGINYSKQIYDRREEIEIKNVGHQVVRGVRTAGGIWATALSIGLAPVTGGASLVVGAAFATGTVAGVVDNEQKRYNGDYQTNNGKGSTIKLTAEQQESKNKLGKKSDSETRQYEARVEQAMPRYDESCRIM